MQKSLFLVSSDHSTFPQALSVLSIVQWQMWDRPVLDWTAHFSEVKWANL